MQRRGFPVSHSSLPAAPSQSSNIVYAAPQAAYAISAALTNPYGQASHGSGTYYSSHYAQAYMQSLAGTSTTPQGYTLSSTYNPSVPYHQNETKRAETGSSRRSHEFSASHRAPSWYQAGNSRCTHPNCIFTGSHKSVELHMMDRHLIYPPGWEKRKKKDDWDADPSLKGKPIPIQGTTIILDSVEELESWIAERKKRWPSVQRVGEKKRKMEEAIARGELLGAGFSDKKRQRIDRSLGEKNVNWNRGRGRGTGNWRGRGNGRTTDAGWPNRGRGRGQSLGSRIPGEGGTSAPNLPGIQASLPIQDSSSSDNSSSSAEEEDDDELPQTLSSKPPAESPTLDTRDDLDCEVALDDPSANITESQLLQPVRKIQPRQPKKPPPNPFVSRPSLLRNLLLPEIRITVSNLSQAIRFLVENDFLENVELKPGQANEGLIQVIDEGTKNT